MERTWYVAGTPVPCRDIGDRGNAACCGCPIRRVDRSDTSWMDCDCRCHESAKALFRATVIHHRQQVAP